MNLLQRVSVLSAAALLGACSTTPVEEKPMYPMHTSVGIIYGAMEDRWGETGSAPREAQTCDGNRWKVSVRHDTDGNFAGYNVKLVINQPVTYEVDRPIPRPGDELPNPLDHRMNRSKTVYEWQVQYWTDVAGKDGESENWDWDNDGWNIRPKIEGWRMHQALVNAVEKATKSGVACVSVESAASDKE